jgi:hypothetical protein
MSSLPRLFGCLAKSGVILFAFNLSLVSAGEHLRREPSLTHWFRKPARYTRETNHGLLHYPTASYWAAGSATNSVDRWDATDIPSQFSYDVAPSPWAYRSIAPYKHHYHPANGTGYWLNDGCDCRN